MTATINAENLHEVLTARLASLRSERDQALAETISTSEGDLADRATNVDGYVRLEMLEQRIVTIENELAASHRPSARSADGTVAVGDVVTLDLGDGPESFLVGSVDQAGGSLDVITPSSPLGKALLGARVGSNITYAIGNRRPEAKIIAIG
jgi:transcription elongation factor GreA